MSNIFDSRLDARVHQVDQVDNDAAVCTVLRWAARTSSGHTAALEAFSSLGVDLRGALTWARGEPEPAPTQASARLEDYEGLGRVAARARTWLYDHLCQRGGSAPAGEIATAAKTAGISSLSTLRAVQPTIGATTCRRGNRWVWELPRDETSVGPT